jgi:lysophospholipid acyltransferase (LPLAT)-like uncharacterized protein
MSLRRKFFGQPWVMKTIGVLGAEYLRLVWKTSRFTIEPDGIYERLEGELPVILAMWHGQHFMAPLGMLPDRRVAVLISRSKDGEINAIAAQNLGLDLIRGSGARPGRMLYKGGVTAMREMIRTLEEGVSVALTADIPKRARVAGMGIVQLAAYSGRPIVPYAVATSFRLSANNWDRASLGLPFGKSGVVFEDAIVVPPDADEAARETARRQVETGLDRAHQRAFALVGGRDPGAVLAARRKAATA